MINLILAEATSGPSLRTQWLSCGRSQKLHLNRTHAEPSRMQLKALHRTNTRPVLQTDPTFNPYALRKLTQDYSQSKVDDDWPRGFNHRVQLQRHPSLSA